MRSDITYAKIAAESDIDPTTQYLNRALQSREDCQVLRELNVLRGKGWRDPLIADHFLRQRNQSDYNKYDDTDSFWANKMFDAMYRMNMAGRFVRANRFLDIGCCPGGYSTYVMRTCLEATGMGISLPIQDGGHGPAIPSELLPRIQLEMQDLTSYDLAPGTTKPYSQAALALNRIPFKPNTFDFVICDGHHLRLNPDNDLRPWNWTRLLLSQLLLGLRAVAPGGTMFIKLSHVERPLTARILLALCRIANLVRTIKSRVVHVHRGSFYVLVQGVRADSEEYTALVEGLERLWYIMTFEGAYGYGRDITWAEQDNVMPWTDVMSPSGVVCIVRLGTRMWQIQRDALKELLRWKGIEVDGN